MSNRKMVEKIFEAYSWERDFENNQFEGDLIEQSIQRVYLDVKDLPRPVVEQIARFQFKFVRDVMQGATFKNVGLKYFGKFAVKPGRLAAKKRGSLYGDDEDK